MRPMSDNEDQLNYRHPDPVIDQALEWVLRRQAGEVSQDALEAWLQESSDRSEALSRVLAVYQCPALTVSSAQTASASRGPVTVIRRSQPARARRFAHLSILLVASIVVAIVVPLTNSDWLMDLRADYRTKAGEIVTIGLPDGSRLQMNSQTAVSLDFDNGSRHVQLLKGEAYFEVVHDAAHPFRVTAGHGTVTVTGTAFNVAREKALDLVHLDSGRIKVSRDGVQSNTVAMSPGQTATIDEAEIAFLPEDEGQQRLAWRKGWIQISAIPLRDALAQIERHTHLTVVTLPTVSLNTPVSGSFRIAEADAAIESVATAAGARIARLPGGIIFIR